MTVTERLRLVWWNWGQNTLPYSRPTQRAGFVRAGECGNKKHAVLSGAAREK